MAEKIKVAPCTGMGKVLATVARIGALLATDEGKSDDLELICTPCVAAGLPREVERIKGADVIVIDGCIDECCRKIFEENGANIVADIKVWEVLRENKDLKPESRVKLGPKGMALAEKVAEKVKSEAANLRG
ncbi:MAG: putative zinc-binding protein [Promethearchaeota archaeon]